MVVPESFPLARFLAERSPSSDSRLARRVADDHQSHLPPRPDVSVGATIGFDVAIGDMSPPDTPGSEGTSLLMSGDSSLPALRRSSVGSLRSRGSRLSSSVRTPEPVEHGGPPLPVTPVTPEDAFNVPRPTATPEVRQPPAIFECPFNVLHCYEKFSSFNAWMRHSVEHFKNVGPPRDARCVFCYRTFHCESGTASWHDKLACAAQHHLREGQQLANAAFLDNALHVYLWENSCITRAEWKALRELSTEHARRGSRSRRSVLGHAGLSPPSSPLEQNVRDDQDLVVMTTNRRRDRERERTIRDIQRLQAQVDGFGDD